MIEMDEFVFDDVLAQAQVTCSFPGLDAVRVLHQDQKLDCTSLFFPGCSFINYGMPLVNALYDFLKGLGVVDGISLLCCGKILEYEPMAEVVRPAYEQQFREHAELTSVQRIVAACPNCVTALRNLLQANESTAHIEVVALPTVLAELGYRIDPEIALAVARQDERLAGAETVTFCFKDSCPDRETNEFANGLRLLMERCNAVEPEHNKKRSICCGSRPRAAGRDAAALKSCEMNHEEARAAGGSALVTACMSCTFLLSVLVNDLPAFHYLELLFNYRIPWNYMDQYMKLRFLFDGSLGVREFYGLDTIS